MVADPHGVNGHNVPARLRLIDPRNSIQLIFSTQELNREIKKQFIPQSHLLNHSKLVLVDFNEFSSIF